MHITANLIDIPARRTYAARVSVEGGRIASIEALDRGTDASLPYVLPGFVDAHTHVAGLGKSFSQLNLIGVETPEEAIRRAVEWSKKIPEASP